MVVRFCLSVLAIIVLMELAPVSASPPKVVPDDTVIYAAVVAADASIKLPNSADESGIGSRFGDPGDPWIGGRMACKPNNYVDQVDHVCAHRWYPCGTILIVENQKTKQRNWCVVKDRGPYGANVFAADGSKVKIEGRDAWFIKIRQDDPPPPELCPDGGCTGKWRGVIDLSPAVSKGMGHTGWGYVKVWRLKRVVDLQRYLAKKAKPLS